MPFQKFSPVRHFISHSDLTDVVEQDQIEVRFFSEKNKKQSLLYAYGMNPCMGIILFGKIQFEGGDEKEEGKHQKYFAVFEHHSGVGEDERLQENCHDAVSNALTKVAEEYELFSTESTGSHKKITLLESFLIRCKQEEGNVQNDLAVKFKTLLAAPQALKKMEDLPENVSLVFERGYQLHCVEENEMNGRDSMECLLSASGGKLDVIYNHNAGSTQEIFNCPLMQADESEDEDSSEEDHSFKRAKFA